MDLVSPAAFPVLSIRTKILLLSCCNFCVLPPCSSEESHVWHTVTSLEACLHMGGDRLQCCLVLWVISKSECSYHRPNYSSRPRRSRVSSLWQSQRPYLEGLGWICLDKLAEKLWVDRNAEMTWRKGFWEQKRRWDENNFTTKLHKFNYQRAGQNLRKADRK